MDKINKMDSFSVLPENEYQTALMLYETGKSLNCKVLFKTRKNGYRVTFNKQSNRRALFWMEISNGTLFIKANLLHIDEYSDIMTNCSDPIKKSITSTKECENCAPNGCGSLHLSYSVDNVKYSPCYFKGHYFSNMDKSDWDMLKNLIVAENNVV